MNNPFVDGPFAQDAEHTFLEQLGEEYLGALRALPADRPAVAFFGSARVTAQHPMYPTIQELARRVGAKGYAILTGSGGGFMAAANAGARQAGAPSLGLNIHLPREQVSNPFVEREVTFKALATRKMVFVRRSTSVVVAPGGFGTLDELFEILTLLQTRKVRPMPTVLMGREHWDGLWTWVRERLLAEGLVGEADLSLFTVVNDVDGALQALGMG